MTLTQLASIQNDSIPKAVHLEDEFDENAFVMEYRGCLLAMMIRLTRDHGRAEDLTQDALLLVIQKHRNNEIRDPSRLKSYLFSVGRFLFLGWLRRADNQLEMRDNFDDILAPTLAPEQLSIALESQEYLEAQIEKLGAPRDREILTRSYFEDEPKYQICDALDLSFEHYDRVISRARQRLRSRIEEDEAESTLLERCF